MTKNKNEVLQFLKDNNDLSHEFMIEEHGFSIEDPDDVNLVSYEYDYHSVQSHGGEGQGDDYYSVYEFFNRDTKEKFYIKFQGWYASYHGEDYTECYLVEPKEKTITVYEKAD